MTGGHPLQLINPVVLKKMPFRRVCLKVGPWVLAFMSGSALHAQTAEEVLQRSAEVITKSTSFSGRAWGYSQHLLPGAGQPRQGAASFIAYEVLRRAPGDWLVVSRYQRSGPDGGVDEGQESFVSQVGIGDAKQGVWNEYGRIEYTTPPEGNADRVKEELNGRLSGDPYVVALNYWRAGTSDPFEWALSEATLETADDKLGDESVWHVSGWNERRQEVHLWLSRENHTLLRSVVVERAGQRVRKITEWSYDQVLNDPPATPAFSQPSRLPFGRQLTVNSLGLTEWDQLLATYGQAKSSGEVVAESPEPKAPVVEPASSAPVGNQRLTPQQMAAIVLIESNDGQASGFMTKLKGVDFVVTNLHVLGPDPKLVVRTLGGDELPIHGIFGAIGRDVAILRIGAIAGELEPLEDVLGEVQIGDEVVVVGNRRGGRVATQVTGKVLGIGPGRIEVDAQFEPGNSGSPVVHLKSGKVIGVATYSETREVDSDDKKRNSEPKVEKRWFAYRIDGISRWESIDLARWKTQYQVITDFMEDTDAFYALVQADFSTGKRNVRIRPYVEAFEERYNRTGRSLAGASELKNFASNLRGRAQAGVRELKSAEFYDYFHTSLYWRTNVKEQLGYRDAVIEMLESLDRNVTSWQSRLRSGG